MCNYARMDREALKAQVAELVTKYGRKNVVRALVFEGLEPSTASLWARGKSTGEPRMTTILAVRKAAEALKKAAAA